MRLPSFGSDVHWTRADEGQGVYSFTIGMLRQPITIHLRRLPNGWWKASRSHAIKTPEQIGKYWGSCRCYDSARQALRREVSAIADYYRMAVDNGHKPQNDWLQPALKIIEGGLTSLSRTD